jgi:hypothetical protein
LFIFALCRKWELRNVVIIILYAANLILLYMCPLQNRESCKMYRYIYVPCKKFNNECTGASVLVTGLIVAGNSTPNGTVTH